MRIRIVLFLIILLNLDSCVTYCDAIEDVKNMEIDGVILKKYILPLNKHSKELDFANHSGQGNNIYLRGDKSKFWEFVQVRDSIHKEKGSFQIDVFRRGTKVRSVKLDYDCP
jgi:hypothetical protein